MPEAQCLRYPIKAGKREALVNWIAGLKSRSEEMTEVMAEIGLIAEAVFMEKSDRGDYMLVYTSADDLAAVTRALASARLPLVREFDQLLTESVEIEKAVTLEFMYHTP